MTLKTIKQIKNLIPFSKDTFSGFVKDHLTGMSNQEDKLDTIVEEVSLTVFEDMGVDELIESAMLVSAQNIQNDIEYDQLASRFLLTSIYNQVLSYDESDQDFSKVYRESFKEYIQKGISSELLDSRLGEIFDLDVLANELVIDRDDTFKFIGLSTALNRYMIHDRAQKNVIETPQFWRMRIAMGMSLNEEDPTRMAKTFYEKLSTVDYIPGGSTNIGAGTTYPVLSNCYLLDTDDDIHSIYDNVKNIALISKATGGIGVAVTKLRSSNSPVKSNNTISTGPIPFVKVMDAALKSMSRGGKKYGAMCLYMENWHLNFPEFIDLRQNNGDDYRRIRTADTAAYISDEFMKRVINNDVWYMFDPAETPELTELYGSEFSKKYKEYCEKADKGEIKRFKTVAARDQMKQMLTALQSTSHPWLTWKDTINLRALNNNTGTIHCSNLCTEITLPQDRDNIAVCNLLYVNAANHILDYGSNDPDDKIDWDRLEDTVRVGMRHLDNLVEINQLPLVEAKNSDEANRAVGMGIMGMAEVFEKFRYSYDSEEAYDLMDRVSEFISYIAIDESCNLAEERGSYANFEGSMWSKGFVPVDTIDKVALDRLGDNGFEQKFDSESLPANNEIGEDPLKNSLRAIKDKIKTGSANASSDETKELFNIFDQLADLINNRMPKNSFEIEEEEYIIENDHGHGIELNQNKKAILDWNRLRERVRDGIRNATVMAIAPNASTGLVAGTSPGIDPRFSQVFSRATSNGKFLDINHNMVNDLKELGLWEEVKDQVLENYGDISEIEEIPAEIRNVYKTSFQISPYGFIEVASRAQKWIDQSMSRNMYLETRNIDEMVDIYTEAWRRGLKTTYYLHVKPRHTSEQSTVRVNKAEKINKKGFASVSTSTQPSMDGQKEIKGFGFATANPEPEEVKVPAQEEPNQEPVFTQMKSGGNFGFGNVKVAPKKESEIEVKANRIKELKNKTKVNYATCPVDPAERALCDACQ